MGSISNKNLGEDSKQALSKEAVEHPTTISVPNSAQTNKAEASKTLHKRVGSDGYLTDELVNELGVTSETHGINTITPLNRHKRADSSDYVTNEMIKKLGNISDLEASNVDGHQLQTDSVLKLLREQEHEDSTKEVRENSNEPDRFLSVEDHWKTCIYPDVLRCLDELMLEHVSIGLELFLTYRSAKYDAYKKRIYSHIFNLELTHKDFFKLTHFVDSKSAASESYPSVFRLILVENTAGLFEEIASSFNELVLSGNDKLNEETFEDKIWTSSEQHWRLEFEPLKDQLVQELEISTKECYLYLGYPDCGKVKECIEYRSRYNDLWKRLEDNHCKLFPDELVTKGSINESYKKAYLSFCELIKKESGDFFDELSMEVGLNMEDFTTSITNHWHTFGIRPLLISLRKFYNTLSFLSSSSKNVRIDTDNISDIKQYIKFIGLGSNPFSKGIRSLIGEKNEKVLLNYAKEDSLLTKEDKGLLENDAIAILIKELNRLISGPLMFDYPCFDKATLFKNQEFLINLSSTYNDKIPFFNLLVIKNTSPVKVDFSEDIPETLAAIALEKIQPDLLQFEPFLDLAKEAKKEYDIIFPYEDNREKFFDMQFKNTYNPAILAKKKLVPFYYTLISQNYSNDPKKLGKTNKILDYITNLLS